MNGLSPRARMLMEAAAGAPPRPDAATKARMKQALLAGAPLAVGAVAGLAKPAGLLQGIVIKLLVGVTAAAVASGAVLAVARRPWARPATVQPKRALDRHGPQPVAERPIEAEPVEQAAPPVPVAPTRVRPPPAVPEPEPARAPLELEAPPRSARAVGPAPSAVEAVRPVKAAEPAARSPVAPLDAELAVLDAALAQLEAQRWDEASATLDRYDARFPRGVLQLESSALRALALCGAGSPEQARAVGRTVLERAPSSPAAARVRNSCAGQ